MSETAEAGRGAVFSPKVVAVVLAVGLFAFSAFAVLMTYAPDLRDPSDGRAHALSSSAVGYRGAVELLQTRGAPVAVTRAPPSPRIGHPLRILTPGASTGPQALRRFMDTGPLLIVLPKWAAAPDPRRPGWVRKVAVVDNDARATALLKAWSKTTTLSQRKGVTRPELRAGQTVYASGTWLPLGPIDRFQTIAGPGWVPALVDETGAAVLVKAKDKDVYVLSEPDLLNTQGLKSLDTARAGMSVVDVLRGADGVAFDVTLAGFERSRSLAKLMFEPPFLAATLCALAAGILMALHAFARFGPAPPEARAFALGKRALVDNSAGLIRMAGKSAALAPAYAEQTEAAVARAVGGDRPRGDWLDALARRRRTTDDRRDLIDHAQAAKTAADLLAVGARLHQWRREMTRDSR